MKETFRCDADVPLAKPKRDGIGIRIPMHKKHPLNCGAQNASPPEPLNEAQHEPTEIASVQMALAEAESPFTPVSPDPEPPIESPDAMTPPTHGAQSHRPLSNSGIKRCTDEEDAIITTTTGGVTTHSEAVVDEKSPTSLDSRREPCDDILASQEIYRRNFVRQQIQKLPLRLDITEALANPEAVQEVERRIASRGGKIVSYSIVMEGLHVYYCDPRTGDRRKLQLGEHKTTSDKALRAIGDEIFNQILRLVSLHSFIKHEFLATVLVAYADSKRLPPKFFDLSCALGMTTGRTSAIKKRFVTDQRRKARDFYQILAKNQKLARKNSK